MTSFTVITGYAGAGKTTVSSLISKIFKYDVINTGDLVWRAVCDAGYTPETRARAGELFVKYFTAADLGDAILKRTSGFEHVIVDGIRLVGTLDRIRNNSRSIRLVAVIAPWHVRHKRLQDRDERVPNETQFEPEIGRLISAADIWIDNSFQMEDPPLSVINARAQEFSERVLHNTSSPRETILPPWITSQPHSNNDINFECR